MTCRDFQHFWIQRASDTLPSDARAHLRDCGACAATIQEDQAADAALRRISTLLQPTAAGPDWNKIEPALDGPPRHRPLLLRRRPAALTALGVAAVFAVLLLWLDIHHQMPTAKMNTIAANHDPSSASHGSPPPIEPRSGASHIGAPSDPGSGTPPPRQPSSPGHERIAYRRSSGGSSVETGGGERPAPEQAARHQPEAKSGSVEALGDPDLQLLNEGHVASAHRFAPAMRSLPLPPQAPLLEARSRGSVVLDDLLNLNPVRVAGAGDVGLSAAVRTFDGEAPTTDARLQQKIWVFASMRKLSDLLARLSKATGVTMLARLEIADEPVTMWAAGRSLMDVMRDLRHLHGYFWSRSKQGGRYVYSLWQDAQSRAEEDAEVQRLAMEQRRQFEQEVWKHVRALTANEAELKQMAQDDPSLIAEMAHPVPKAAYQLFAALSPDQQVQLTRGQTPSRAPKGGGVLEMFPVKEIQVPWSTAPHGEWSIPTERNSDMAPTGDTVTLSWGDLSPAERAAVRAVFQGAAAELEREARMRKFENPQAEYFNDAKRIRAQAASVADLETAAISLFRAGEPLQQAICLRIDFSSGGNRWWLYSGFAQAPGWRSVMDESLKAGVFAGWPGGQEAVDHYLGKHRNPSEAASAPRTTKPASPEPPDPILDAPISVTWTLPLRGTVYSLAGAEILERLCQATKRPLIMDNWGERLELPRTGPAEFRWQARPLRELLQHLFPRYDIQTSGGAIFLHGPYRLRERLNQVPRAVDEFLKAGKGLLTLDEMALLVRSLTPWQVAQLEHHLRPVAMDQILALRELLMLYGELAPAQRARLSHGVAYTDLTPTQQALFVQFAQRQRPFVEPWRFQQGGIRMAEQPTAPPVPGSGEPVAKAQELFEVRFQDGDTQPFTLGFYDRYEQWWERPLTDLVDRPFPFPARGEAMTTTESWTWQPALAAASLRKRALVIVLTRSFDEPYAGTQPPPSPELWTRSLAARLGDTGYTVVHVTMGPKELTSTSRSSTAHLIHLFEPNGEPLGVMGPGGIPTLIQKVPTIFVVGSDEVVRAVIQGDEAWDTATVERAVRASIASRSASPTGAHPRAVTN